jgi:flagellar biosynthesis protein FlhG
MFYSGSGRGYQAKSVAFLVALIYADLTMQVTIPIASGKGGVGKTIFTANLGIALASLGKTVILVDLDLGSSNLHTCLGIKNRHAGIGSLIYKKAESLESLVVETGYPRLFLIPGDSLLPGTANLPYFRKLKILKELELLTADFVLLDLGAGSSYNVIDFFLAASSGLIVTSPETTAILSSYSFLKTAVFRLLYRSFPNKSDEREYISDFMTERIEGSGTDFTDLLSGIEKLSPEAAEVCRKQLLSFFPRIILNMGKSNQDLLIGSKLRTIATRNLGISMEYIGFLKWEEGISRSILERKPYLQIAPESAFSRSMAGIAKKLVSTPLPAVPKLFEGNEDIMILEAELDHG